MRIRAIVTAAVVVAACLMGGAGPASARVAVDPATLTPVPPGAECWSTGGTSVVCHTSFDATHDFEEAFPLPCGTLYEAATDVRRGIRWYADGLLVRRAVFQQASGAWSLSPTGAGPLVTWVAQDSWVNDHLDPLAPEDDWPFTTRGMALRVTGADGQIFQLAGLQRPDGSHSGVGDWAVFDSPGTQAALCAALAA